MASTYHSMRPVKPKAILRKYNAVTNQPLSQEDGQIFEVRMKAQEAKEDHV